MNNELVKKAVEFLTNPNVQGTVQLKMAFLKKKGLNDNEIMEALNAASGGALVSSALGLDN